MKINIEIEVTKYCNLNCFYCCAETQLYNKTNEINWSLLKYFLKKIKNKKNDLKIEYLITGGEPLTYTHINEVFEFFETEEYIDITLLTNLTKKINTKKPLKDLLTSLHIQYYDLFEKNIMPNLLEANCLNKRINILLDDFENSKINKIQLKKILNTLSENNIKLIPQFLTLNLNYDNSDLNEVNRKKWFEYLKDYKWFFYEIETTDRFNDYIKQDFNFKGTYCYPLGYIIRWDGDLQRDCGSFPTLCNIKNSNCWKKIKLQKIKCNENFCNSQITIENPKSIHGDF